MGPQAAQAKITSQMTLSERADAIEEHMMHELDKSSPSRCSPI